MDVDAIHVSATWWRQVPAGSDVLYTAAHPADNRWQRGAEVDAWYFGDEPDTVWAEWYRVVADLGVPPAQLLPRDLWAWEISLAHVANLSDASRLARVGLSVPRPDRSQWPAFQAVGEQLHDDGFQALVAPSAARAERLVLCVFRTASEMPGARPTPPPQRIDEPPNVPRGLTT